MHWNKYISYEIAKNEMRWFLILSIDILVFVFAWVYGLKTSYPVMELPYHLESISLLTWGSFALMGGLFFRVFAISHYQNSKLWWWTLSIGFLIVRIYETILMLWRYHEWKKLLLHPEAIDDEYQAEWFLTCTNHDWAQSYRMLREITPRSNGFSYLGELQHLISKEKIALKEIDIIW